MKKIALPMYPDNIAKIVAGTKTTTVRSESYAKIISLEIGQEGCVTFLDKSFKVINRGLLTIEEAGGKEVIIKSEGVLSEEDFKFKQTRDWVNGKGRLFVYDISMI